MQLCGDGGQTAAQHLLDCPNYLNERETLLNKIVFVLPNIWNKMQKWLPWVFNKKGFSLKFCKIHRKTLVPESLFQPQACNFIKKSLRHIIGLRQS